MIADLVVVEGEADMARQLARRFVHVGNAAIAAHRRFAVALTGGSSARLYRALRDAPLDWERTELYWGDERAVPAAHADSNYRLAREMLLDDIPIPEENVRRMPADEADLESAARTYEEELPDALDLVHLGMGPDGHVCSLFPGHRLLREARALVRWLDDAPKPPPRRMTLTMPALLRAHVVLVTAQGADKAGAVAAAVTDAGSLLPIAQVARGNLPVVFLLDRDAAAALPSRS